MMFPSFATLLDNEAITKPKQKFIEFGTYSAQNVLLLIKNN